MEQRKEFMNYCISNQGRIKNKHGRILRPRYNKGYIEATILGKYYRLHRLVAQLFIENPDNKIEINHKNGIKDDNRIENLERCTHSENIQHSYRELHPPLPRIKKERVKIYKIGQYTLDNKPLNQFYSCVHASRTIGIQHTSIWRCCNGIYKQAGGYNRKYI